MRDGWKKGEGPGRRKWVEGERERNRVREEGYWRGSREGWKHKTGRI